MPINPCYYWDYTLHTLIFYIFIYMVIPLYPYKSLGGGGIYIKKKIATFKRVKRVNPQKGQKN